jgi:hypothetical protein
MNEYQRRKEIGDYGEMVVCEQLAKSGWQNCTHIGGFNPCYDIEAYKGGQKHLFSVKARNHTRYTGEIKKDDYNLFHRKRKEDDFNAQVREGLRIAHNQNATPMWATVRVDAERQKYGICYGRVADLKDKRYAPMSPSAILSHDKLAWDVFDERIKPEWSNIRSKKKAS